jgi:hypothetical protein
MREEDPQEWWDERSRAADRLVDYYLTLRTPGLEGEERQRWAEDAAFWVHIGILLEHATNETDAADFRADVLTAHVIEDHELAEEDADDAGDADSSTGDEQATRSRRMN